MPLLQSETRLVWYITGDRNQSDTNLPPLLAVGFGPPAPPAPSRRRPGSEELPRPVLLTSDGATLHHHCTRGSPTLVASAVRMASLEVARSPGAVSV